MINKIKRVILVCINYFIRFLTNKTFHTIAIIWLLILQFLMVVEFNENVAWKSHTHSNLDYAERYHRHNSDKSYADEYHEHEYANKYHGHGYADMYHKHEEDNPYYSKEMMLAMLSDLQREVTDLEREVESLESKMNWHSH